MGRHSTYTPETAEEICRRIADGETLRAICRDKGMPAHTTVLLWVAKDVDGFAERYVRARDIGYDVIAEEALAIADTPAEGVEVEESEQGVKTKRGDMLGHRKLQVETRLRLLSKWCQKRYGDRQAVEMSGNLALGEMSEADIKAELATLLASGLEPKDGSDLV